MSQSFEPVFRSANGYYLELGPNQEGRDFVIGDIHGERQLPRPEGRSLPLAGWVDQGKP